MARRDNGQGVGGAVARLANRDPGPLRRPATSGHRAGRQRHMACGHGIHYCLGDATWARWKAEIAVQTPLAGQANEPDE